MDATHCKDSRGGGVLTVNHKEAKIAEQVRVVSKDVAPWVDSRILSRMAVRRSPMFFCELSVPGRLFSSKP